MIPVFPADTSRGQAQRVAAGVLHAAGMESAALDTRLLLCAALGIDHAALVCDPDHPIGAATDAFAAFLGRRLRHEPVSRILGRREFWGLSFQIAPGVLDPRADTEVLVAAVLELAAERRTAPLRVLDLGTGSGAILAALLGELPAAHGLGLDRSEAACRIARDNLGTLGLAGRATVAQGSWDEKSWDEALCGPFDIVVSNPPYIATREIRTLAPDVRDYDPHGALDGGPDGLCPYRAIVPALPQLLAPGGIAGFEVGATQGEAVAALLRGSGLAGIAIQTDLAGHGRVVTGRAASQAAASSK